MSVIEQSRLSPMIPDEWQEKYSDLTIKTTESGHDYLYGVDKETDNRERLSWKPLDQAVEDNFGYKPAGFFPGLRAENEMLRQQRELLTDRLEGFEQTLRTERESHQREVEDLKQEMSDMEERFNTKIEELETRLRRSPAPAGAIDANRFKEVRRWQPRPGDAIPVHDAENENVLVIESVNPDGETVRVRNSQGQIATLPLAQVAGYWNAEQIRKRSKEDAVAEDTSLRGRLSNAYNRVIRRRTEVVPTAVVNEEGEVLVVQEEREVDNRRGAAAVVLGAAALVAAGFIGYELGKSDEQPRTVTNTVTRTVPRPISSNSIVIGKQRYHVLLNEEKKLGAEEAKDAQLKASNQALRDKVHALQNDEKKLDAAEAKNAQLRAKNQELREKVHNLRTGDESYGGAGNHTETLNYYGDTVWSHAQRLLERKTGKKPNTAQIRKLTARVLNMNGLRWQGGGYGVDAHRLPVGMELKIPNNVE